MRGTLARLTLTAVLLAGTGIALYLTAHHDHQVYGDRSFKLENCPQTETVDCEAVNTSAWSELAGAPIAAFAVPLYLLVLGLAWAGRREPACDAYAFTLGLAAVAVSMALHYVSKVQIGFLCLWCMRLYGVNLAIPILVAIAAGRWPRELVAATIADLVRWPRPLTRSAGAGVALLLATLGGERLYRSHVHEAARLRVTAPGSAAILAAAPRSPAPPASATRVDPATDIPYRLTAPLRRVIPERGRFRAEVFDVQSRLGSGTPVALLHWAPGFTWSEHALVTLANEVRTRWPAIELYAAAGRRTETRDEELYETFGMLPLPAGLPLLIDDEFAVAKALHSEEVPSLVVFDRRGKLVASGLRDLAQRVVDTEGFVLSTADVLTRVVSEGGPDAASVRTKYPYFPAMALDRTCAPGFTLKRFGTDDDFTFRPASGRPTLLLFWSATCKHCQMEIPQLVKWLGEHPGELDVVSITRVPPDEPGKPSRRAITTEYVRTTGIPFPVLDDWGGAVNDRYAVVSTPTSVFVSPGGAIADTWFFAHPDGFDAAMQRALAKARATAACTIPPPAPSPTLAIRVNDVEGATHELPALVDRPSIVHLWATWCQPCLAELPSLLVFEQRVESAGKARVLLVSVEPAQAAPTVAAFSQRVGFRSLLAPSGGIADVIDLSYHVPRTYLVAPGGRVLDILHGKQEWRDPVFQQSVLSRLANAAS